MLDAVVESTRRKRVPAKSLPGGGPTLLTKILPVNIHGRHPKTQGDILEDRNRGGVGDRWAILNAISAWGDEDGEQRTHLIHGGSLHSERDVCIARRFPPLVCGDEPEIKRNAPMESCRNPPRQSQDTFALIRSEPPRLDKEARTRGKRKTPLQTWDEMRRQAFSKYVGSAGNPESARGIGDMDGRRVPEIFKLAHGYGNTAERAPPYRPEVPPIEFHWCRLKGGHGKRYEASGPGSTSISFSLELKKAKYLWS